MKDVRDRIASNGITQTRTAGYFHIRWSFLLTKNQWRFIMFSNNENWSGDNDKEN